MPKAKITKTFVDRVPYAEKGQVIYCDTELRGFYLIVGKTAKTYVAQKDIRGRSIRYTIGRHHHFTPEQARTTAKDKLYLMSQDIDPHAEEKEQEATLITLRKVLQNYQSTRKAMSDKTKREYTYYLHKYLPDWLDKPLVEIDKDMIVLRHTTIGESNGPYTANGTMRIVRALMNHANATYDICEINPVGYLSKIKAWYPEKRRRTYIKPHQLQPWWEAVNSLKNETQRDFLLFLLFTGLRRGEAASIQWQDIDFADKTFIIRRTKNGDPLTLPMGDFLFGLFQSRRQKDPNGTFVFPGPGKEGYLVEPKKSIYKVVGETGIKFTCHDLRRTFITIAESLDISSYALKRLINHRINDVTGGYIILDAERLRSPVYKIEKFILGKVHGQKYL